VRRLDELIAAEARLRATAAREQAVAETVSARLAQAGAAPPSAAGSGDDVGSDLVSAAAAAGNALEAADERVYAVVQARRSFEKRWGIAKGLSGPQLATRLDALERSVRRKVRRDLRTARAWDGELEACPDDNAREAKLLEFMRFEHLTTVERVIYQARSNPPPKTG
jgi:hypothetical protein